MPQRKDIHKVLIIGSGPIIIGQACEFDYSGTQACKALRSLGYEIVLVNSNPATIMTDPGTADRTYIEPLNIERLYLPTAFLLFVWIATLRRREWLAWFLTSGHLCHFVITTLLLPAAYFKYYYSEYLYAFLAATMLLCVLRRRSREKKKAAAAVG